MHITKILSLHLGYTEKLHGTISCPVATQAMNQRDQHRTIEACLLHMANRFEALGVGDGDVKPLVLAKAGPHIRILLPFLCKPNQRNRLAVKDLPSSCHGCCAT